MLLCLLLSLTCAQEPGPKQALTLARAELEQRGADTADLQPCPEADLGPHRCYRAGGLFVFVGPSGALRADGSGDWYTALSGAEPLKVAAVLERLGSAEKSQLQSPSGRKPSQVSAEAWARVSAPKIEELPGALVFTAWYASPPAFDPWQLRLEARPGTPARVSRHRVKATPSPQIHDP